MANPVDERFARLKAYADSVTPLLDKKTYYQILEVPQTADAATLKKAFYRLAQILHPDRYHTHPDAEARERLQVIYARACEGYRVLSNPEKKAAYDKGLTTGQLR